MILLSYSCRKSAYENTKTPYGTLAVKTIRSRRCLADSVALSTLGDSSLYGFSVPWPYPDNGAENYVNNVALPDMEKGIAWIWTIRLREAPDALIGLICLYDVEDNNRGFWLDPEYQGQGFMREASNIATDYWFNTLNKTVLRAPKASLNIRSKRISDSSGMRLIKTEKKEYVSGLLDSELWEITRDEWNARQVG